MAVLSDVHVHVLESNHVRFVVALKLREIVMKLLEMTREIIQRLSFSFTLRSAIFPLIIPFKDNFLQLKTIPGKLFFTGQFSGLLRVQ